MYILNEENTAVDLNLVPNECDIYFWVYDAAKDVRDYHVSQLIMLDNFYSPVVKLNFSYGTSKKNFRQYSLNVPADYQLLIGDSSFNDLELIPVTSLSDRGFTAFENNPLSSYRVTFWNVNASDVLPNVKWFMPRVHPSQLLCIPLSSDPKSPCVYLAREVPKSLETFPLKDAL